MKTTEYNFKRNKNKTFIVTLGKDNYSDELQNNLYSTQKLAIPLNSKQFVRSPIYRPFESDSKELKLIESNQHTKLQKSKNSQLRSKPLNQMRPQPIKISSKKYSDNSPKLKRSNQNNFLDFLKNYLYQLEKIQQKPKKKTKQSNIQINSIKNRNQLLENIYKQKISNMILLQELEKSRNNYQEETQRIRKIQLKINYIRQELNEINQWQNQGINSKQNEYDPERIKKSLEKSEDQYFQYINQGYRSTNPYKLQFSDL